MKIYDFSISARKCYVIYTGPQYIFTFEGCGIFAIADRITKEGLNSDKEEFSLLVGNDYAPAGDNEVVKRCKTFISREENQFIKKSVLFDVKKDNLHNYGAIVKTVKRF